MTCLVKAGDPSKAASQWEAAVATAGGRLGRDGGCVAAQGRAEHGPGTAARKKYLKCTYTELQGWLNFK